MQQNHDHFFQQSINLQAVILSVNLVFIEEYQIIEEE
jgi:hypothetical protein